MSDSVRPQRRQPTRLPCPWDSPSKNTGVSCHFLLQCTKVKSESEVTQLCPTLSDPTDSSPPGSSVHGIFQARVLEWGAIAFSGHTLLEHYISCCPSFQLPCVPGAARGPVTQAAAPPPHLALTGANPSSPGQLQEQSPVDDPHAEVELKPQLKPRGRVAKEEDPKPSHQLYKQQIQSTSSTRQTLCLWTI